MNKILDEKAEKFSEFLRFYDLLIKKDRNTKDATETFENQLLLYRVEFKNGNWDQDDELFSKGSEVIDWVDLEITTLFQDGSDFCQFLFNQDSVRLFVNQQNLKNTKAGNAISRKDVGECICEALTRIQTFFSNYKILPDLMFFVSRQHIIVELSKKIKSNYPHIQEWSGLGIILYSLKNSEALEISINQEDFLYGYRDFSRIFNCRLCNAFFLAKRKDSVFCSDKCKNSFKYNKYISNEKKKAEYLLKKRLKYKDNKREKENRKKLDKHD